MAHAGGRKGIEMTNKKCYKSYVPALPHGHRAEVLVSAGPPYLMRLVWCRCWHSSVGRAADL
jgi:hypothetical protein